MNAALDAFDWSIRACVRLAELATVLIAFFITGSMILGVFFRFVLNWSIGWTDEVSSLLLAVMMFFVIGIGLHERLHISVAIVIEKFPPAGQKIFDICIHVVCAVFFFIVAYEGQRVAESALSMQLATIPVARGVFYYAMPIGAGFATLVCVNNILRIASGKQRPGVGGIG